MFLNKLAINATWVTCAHRHKLRGSRYENTHRDRRLGRQ